MGTTSKGAPFAISKDGLFTVHDDGAIIAVTHHHRAFRQWRPAQPARSPIAQVQDSDPYLLVLLADQEFHDQRPEQAESLIEAAYVAYDQCRWGS